MGFSPHPGAARSLLTALAVAVASCSSEEASPPATSAATSGSVVTTPSTSSPATSMVVSISLVRDEHVAVAHRDHPATVATLRAAIGELLSGPSSAESSLGLASAVPPGTALNDVSISDGVASIDLSAPFAAGGGTLSMSLRLAQLVYTATQFPTVDAVVLLLDGVPVTTFGGEGIVIDHPLTRADFEEQTPAILVETPAPFDEVDFPLRLTGSANVFEAMFMIRLTDAAGTTFYERQAMATSGSGTRGTFDVTIEARPGAHGTGIVRLWEPSARDGSETNVVEFPVEM